MDSDIIIFESIRNETIYLSNHSATSGIWHKITFLKRGKAGLR